MQQPLGPKRHFPRAMRPAPSVAGVAGALLAASLAAFPGCGSDESTTSALTLTGDPWVPNVPGAGAANHDASVVVTQTELAQQSGPLVGLAQGWSGREFSFVFDMTQDLGDHGSISLLAETVGFPASLRGSAYPLLTSLNDGTNELVNLTRTGTGGDCAQSGAYACPGGDCDPNPACAVRWPSAYLDRTHWEQHQLDFTFGAYASTNTFPTCNWSGGAVPASASDPVSASDRPCAFNTHFFSSGKLRSGGTYTAKYVLMTDSYASLSGHNGTLKLSVVKKAKASNASAGAVDVNLIFVGHSVSQASRNAQGKVNLDSLMKAVHDFYAHANVNVKLGAIRSFEWLEGEAYANVALDDMGAMIASAGAALPADTSGKAVNIYFVNSVADSASLLGISGGIGGPMVNRLPSSGVVVSTFGKLDQYNPRCSAAPCALSQVEYDFADLEQTVAHEMGHYLGLNHPSESSGTAHDLVRDTPICTATSAFAGNKISIGSCLNTDVNTHPTTGLRCSQACSGYSTSAGQYCPAAIECQFNYMMYWSSKFFTEGTGAGDGNLFSPQSGTIMNYHPLVQ